MAYINKSEKRKPWEGDRVQWEGKNLAFYQSPVWRNLARAKRQRNPICEGCYKEGRVTPGEMVDHIKPIQQGGDPLSWDNLQTLCNSCHGRKSQKEKGLRNSGEK